MSSKRILVVFPTDDLSDDVRVHIRESVHILEYQRVFTDMKTNLDASFSYTLTKAPFRNYRKILRYEVE